MLERQSDMGRSRFIPVLFLTAAFAAVISLSGCSTLIGIERDTNPMYIRFSPAGMDVTEDNTPVDVLIEEHEIDSRISSAEVLKTTWTESYILPDPAKNHSYKLKLGEQTAVVEVPATEGRNRINWMSFLTGWIVGERVYDYPDVYATDYFKVLYNSETYYATSREAKFILEHALHNLKKEDLADKTINLNAVDHWGMTLLMWQAQFGRENSIRLLLDAGAEGFRKSTGPRTDCS
jgi:hypothetical protein